MQNNPFVGPRPFERQDLANFYGRRREARDLLSLIVANRVVLFYSPPGAGKTSLINAQIIPDLEEHSFDVLPVAHVGNDVPQGIDPHSVKNVFVLSVLMGLVADPRPATSQRISANDLIQATLFQFLQLRKVADATGDEPEEHGDDWTLFATSRLRPPVLILDQFEEILTTHRARWQDVQGFFEQLGEALRKLPDLGVVFVMREDHVAGIEPYAALLPKRLKVRYRMEWLTVEGALEAVAKPALRAGVPFAPGVAERLVDNLRHIKAAHDARDLPANPDAAFGPYVAPVHLQAVCNRLWENLPEDLDHDIQWDEVRHLGDLEPASIKAKS